MRKIFFILVLVLLLLLALPALAQNFFFEGVNLTIDIPNTYTIITPQTAEANAQFLLSKGYNASEVGEIFAADGILLQAWNASGDVCFQLTALQDADGTRYFNIDDQTVATRGAYRKEHLSGEAYKTLGIKYSSAEWKKTSQYGRVLMLKYTQKEGDTVVSRGYARRTIRNGYTVTFDMQVFGRTLKGADNDALNKIMASVFFTEGEGAAAVGKIVFEDIPPEETNTASFTVTGRGAPGLTITGTLVSISATNATNIDVTINKKGEFSMPVTLPHEGVFMLTFTVKNGDTVTEEPVFPAINYNASLLPVNILVPSELPSFAIDSNKTIISGTSVKGAKVQLLYGDTNKTVKVGSKNTFSFSVDTSKEGVYDFTLVFSKTGAETRRFNLQGTRVLTQSEIQAAYKKDAVKPSYKNLVNKINGYDGRIMVYSPYITEIRQDGEDWLVTMAMTRNNNGSYKDFIVMSTTQEPTFTIGNAYKMYLRCIGMYTTLSEGGSEQNYPHFELLFVD